MPSVLTCHGHREKGKVRASAVARGATDIHQMKRMKTMLHTLFLRRLLPTWLALATGVSFVLAAAESPPKEPPAMAHE